MEQLGREVLNLERPDSEGFRKLVMASYPAEDFLAKFFNVEKKCRPRTNWEIMVRDIMLVAEEMKPGEDVEGIGNAWWLQQSEKGESYVPAGFWISRNGK